MSLSIQGLAIYLSRGDSAALTVQCGEHEFTTGDVLHFTVIGNRGSGPLFCKTVSSFEDGVAVIPIEADDTAGKPLGQYRYGLHWTDSAGAVRTLLPPAGEEAPLFTLCDEVAFCACREGENES